MNQKKIYLDYNANAPIQDAVIADMSNAFRVVGNPSSVHHFGRQARALLENARETIATFVHAKADEAVFTSGGSEANNAILHHFCAHDGVIITSNIEHESVKQVAPDAKIISVNESGTLDVVELEKHLIHYQGKQILVSVMLANNETGVIQPIEDIVHLARKYEAYVHTDAVQALGKVKIDFHALGVDYMTLSGHKIGGPVGVGMMLIRQHAPFKAYQKGGGQEKGRRSGTSNVAGAVGFASALTHHSFESWEHCRKLRDHLETRVKNISNEIRIAGSQANRLPNTSNILMPGVPSNKQVMAFDLSGFAVSAGSACSSGVVKESSVLTAMGYSSEEANQTTRVSLGPQTTENEINAFVECWIKLYQQSVKQR